MTLRRHGLTKKEFLAVVNEKDEVIAKKPRQEVHEKKLLHRAVLVFVRNSKWLFFIQKRSETKDVFPGCFDASVTGHVSFGESYEKAAAREMLEELGLKEKPMFLFKLRDREEDNLIYAVFECKTAKQPKIDKKETAQAIFADEQKIEEIIKKEKTTSWLKAAWEQYKKK